MFSERKVLVRVEKVRLKGRSGTTTNILKMYEATRKVQLRISPRGISRNYPDRFLQKFIQDIPPKVVT